MAFWSANIEQTTEPKVVVFMYRENCGWQPCVPVETWTRAQLYQVYIEGRPAVIVTKVVDASNG